MLNKNAFKTSLLFLGIILLVLGLRMFLLGESHFVQAELRDTLANSICLIDKSC